MSINTAHAQGGVLIFAGERYKDTFDDNSNRVMSFIGTDPRHNTEYGLKHEMSKSPDSVSLEIFFLYCFLK
jgi:hypothetical protein